MNKEQRLELFEFHKERLRNMTDPIDSLIECFAMRWNCLSIPGTSMVYIEDKTLSEVIDGLIAQLHAFPNLNMEVDMEEKCGEIGRLIYKTYELQRDRISPDPAESDLLDLMIVTCWSEGLKAIEERTYNDE